MLYEPKLLALYGLKWNPFTSEVPIELCMCRRRSRTSAGASNRRTCGRVASRSSKATRHWQKRGHAAACRAAVPSADLSVGSSIIRKVT